MRVNRQAEKMLTGDGLPRVVLFVNERSYKLAARGPIRGVRWKRAPAVIGIDHGSEWSRSLADRIPDGSHVAIATPDSDDGDSLADVIGTTIAARVVAGRLRADRRRPCPKAPDLDDLIAESLAAK